MPTRDLIVFGEDWGGHPSSTQHIVSHLAADRRVLWVNSLGLRRPRLSWRDLSRAGAKLKSAFCARPRRDGAERAATCASSIRSPSHGPAIRSPAK